MNELDRRSLLKAMTAVPFAYCEALSVPSQEPVSVVASHTDRTGHPHKAARANSHLDFKVLTGETNGRVFIMENRDMVRGGPPRHVHYEQEEWFFFLEGGEVIMEIGEQKMRLKPGDSVFAPRKVPHVWAYIGEQPGRQGHGPATIRSPWYEGSGPSITGLTTEHVGAAQTDRWR